MEDELLQELDHLLKPAIKQAWSSAKRVSGETDPRGAFLDLMQVQIDNTRVKLSKNLHKIDLAMNGNCYDVEQVMAEINKPKELNVDISKYVREVADGTEVFDGSQWFLFSKEAQIDLQIDASPKNGNIPSVQINAYDPKTDFRIAFIDNNIEDEGYNFSYAGNDERFSSAANSYRSWEDPYYKSIKRGIGVTGKVSGSIAAYKMSQHYVNYADIWKSPFSGPTDFTKGIGKFKSLDGQWTNFDELRNANAFKQNSYKSSAHWAKARGAKAGKVFRRAGRICFVVSVAFSLNEMGIASYTNDSNRNEVYLKSGLDITMGIVAFIPVVGWAISGTYFIADAFGAFGDFGELSGISQEAYDMRIIQEMKVKYGDQLKTIEFDIDYVAPIESSTREFYEEERRVRIDNTRVAPRVNIHKLGF